MQFASNLGNWVPVAGFFYDWRHGGPRRTVLAGAFLTLLGYGGLWLASICSSAPPVWLLWLLWFSWGHGGGYFDCSAVVRDDCLGPFALASTPHIRVHSLGACTAEKCSYTDGATAADACYCASSGRLVASVCVRSKSFKLVYFPDMCALPRCVPFLPRQPMGTTSPDTEDLQLASSRHFTDCQAR